MNAHFLVQLLDYILRGNRLGTGAVQELTFAMGPRGWVAGTIQLHHTSAIIV